MNLREIFQGKFFMGENFYENPQTHKGCNAEQLTYIAIHLIKYKIELKKWLKVIRKKKLPLASN